MHRILRACLIVTVSTCGCGRQKDAAQSPRPALAAPAQPAASGSGAVVEASAPGSASASGSAAADQPVVTPACIPPAGGLASPATISGVVTLLNALPKPTTLACLLAALPRPLGVQATRSMLSIQPAASPESPRIFLRLDKLVLAIVPDGPNAGLLEMSELVSDTNSVKGELLLPTTAALVATAAFDRIKRDDGRTACAGCHQNEAKAPPVYGDAAVVSRALRPLSTSIMPLDALKSLGTACAASETPRCAVLRALVGDGTGLIDAPFPPGMPTFF